MDARAKAIAALSKAGYGAFAPFDEWHHPDGHKRVSLFNQTGRALVNVNIEDLPALLSPLTIERVEAAVRDELRDVFITNGIATEGMVNPIADRIIARLKEVPHGITEVDR